MTRSNPKPSPSNAGSSVVAGSSVGSKLTPLHKQSTRFPILGAAMLCVSCLLAMPAYAGNTPPTLGTASNYAVLGIGNSTLDAKAATLLNSNIQIFGNEGIGFGGTVNNMAPSTVHGNVYEYQAGQISGAGHVMGSTIVNGALLNQNYVDAVSASSQASALTPTQSFGTVNSATTVHGNGGLNVIQVNGDILNSFVLSGGPSDVFVVNVTGTVNLSGATSLGLGDNVTAGQVLYNLTSSGKNVMTHVTNVINGTILAINDTITVEGVFNGQVISAKNITLLSNSTVNYVPFTPPTNPTMGPTACNPTSSLSVLLGNSGVTAYIPNGSWDVSSQTTGVLVVPIEPTGTPVAIATPAVVNSCASNSTTGQTVCTANNTDVYLISGSNLNGVLTSGSTAATDFSGGNCYNCGVAIESNSNTAVIAMGLANSPSGSGLQLLNLNSNSFTAPLATSNEISEDVLWDPIRNLILSPNEDGVYDVFKVQSGSMPEFGYTMGGTLDSAGEDCTTGIALSTDEYTSNIVLSDLTQATFTPGSPGSWTAPLNVQNIPEWNPYDGSEAGTDGIAIATGSHLGIVIGEYPFPPSQANAVMAIQLPSTSGSGTPALQDYAVAQMPNDPAGNPFSLGCDPHTVAAYVSPVTGKATAVLTDYGPTTCYSGGTPQYVALLDLQGLLNAPRVSGTHTVDPSYDLVGNNVVKFVATH